jgi:hypothetical protein
MARKKIVETFGSTTQRVSGWVMLAIVVAFAVDIVAQWEGREAWIPFTVALLFGTAAWITSIRPLVVAYEDKLQVRNFLRTADLDWAAVERAEMHGDLTIYPVDENKGTLKAISVSARRPDGSKGLTGMRNLFGMGGAGAAAKVDTGLDVADSMRGLGEQRPTPTPPIVTARTIRGDHAKGRYAVERITALSTNAKNLTPDRTEWIIRWSIPECVVLSVAVVLLVLAIIFR